MTVEMAQVGLLGVLLYLGIGIVIGLIFVAFALPRLDWAGRGGGVFFRLMILPGVTLLWPIIVVRSLSGRVINQPPDQSPQGDAEVSP